MNERTLMFILTFISVLALLPASNAAIQSVEAPSCVNLSDSFQVNFTVDDVNYSSVSANVTSSYKDVEQFAWSSNKTSYSFNYLGGNVSSAGLYNFKIRTENMTGTVDTEEGTVEGRWNCNASYLEERSQKGLKIGFWFSLLLLGIGIISILAGVVTGRLGLVMLGAFLLLMVGVMYIAGASVMEGYNETVVNSSEGNVTVMQIPTGNKMMKYSFSVILSLVGIVFLAMLFFKHKKTRGQKGL